LELSSPGPHRHRTGGTFTDVLAADEETGQPTTSKVTAGPVPQLVDADWDNAAHAEYVAEMAPPELNVADDN
jgi:hypothetical protein